MVLRCDSPAVSITALFVCVWQSYHYTSAMIETTSVQLEGYPRQNCRLPSQLANKIKAMYCALKPRITAQTYSSNSSDRQMPSVEMLIFSGAHSQLATG